MEGWVQNLQGQFEALNSAAAERIEKQRNLLKSSLRQTPCGKCGTQTLDGDLVRFGCKKKESGDNRRHVMCFDCVGDALERQRGYLERFHAKVSTDSPIFKDVVLCYECHTPHVIHQKSVFDTGFNQTQLKVKGRVHYSVSDRLTKALDGKYKVHVCEEKMTRGLLSKFRPKRGETLPRADESPGASQIWLENWTCDTNEGDPQGWLYARDWPGTFMFERGGAWHLTPSMSTFVRQRRLYRTAVTLSPELQKLKRANEEEEKARAREDPSTPGAGNGSDGLLGNGSQARSSGAFVLNGGGGAAAAPLADA